VVDVNRHRDQEGENGVIKLTDFQGGSLYPEGFTLEDRAKERRLKRYWDGYHRQIAELLRKGSAAFFIDAHAMSPVGPKLGPDEGKPRPALSIVTGGDREGEPLELSRPTSIPGELARWMARKLLEHFAPVLDASDGVPPTVTINDPFAGGGIQQRYSDPALPFCKPGFAIEVNRALYLETGLDGFDRPIPGRVEALNRAFNAFLRDLLPALMQRSLIHRARERAFICNG
jgi:N-formylglutamate amidohydrolase